MQKKYIAGMSIKGGRKDNFFFCLLEFYPETKRYFLRSLLNVKDEDKIDGNEALKGWTEKYGLKKLIVSFPLTRPVCFNCKFVCPGAPSCKDPSMIDIRSRIEQLIKKDSDFSQKHPKLYEKERNASDEIDYSKDVFWKNPKDHILTKSFKRRLKKGVLPYWNRPIDFWVWTNYHDPLLSIFNISFDSYGNTSLMLMSRFAYMQHYFMKKLELFESNFYLTLLEFLRSGVVTKRDLLNLNSFETVRDGRRRILKKLEKEMGIFIYEKDFELLSDKQYAFESFILALSGKSMMENKIREIPSFARPTEVKFTVPLF